jgi:predicted nucleic acid-binding protein
LFGEITIPEKVFTEVVVANSEKYGSSDVKECTWIKTAKIGDTILKTYLLQTLDEGEAEVIVLANELKADLVVIDERLARSYAEKAEIRLIGTLGILAKSKLEGYIPNVRDLVQEMLSKGIWFSKALVNRVLIELCEEPL